MDPFSIGVALAALLGPLLTRAGGVATDRLGDAAGEAVASQIRRLWRRLGPRLDQDPEAARSVSDLAADPADPDARTALGDEIGAVLAGNAELLRMAAELLAATERGISVTGDGNTVQSGSGNISIQGSSGIHLRDDGRG
jgi:hypothetical protein